MSYSRISCAFTLIHFVESRRAGNCECTERPQRETQLVRCDNTVQTGDSYC